MHEHFEHVGALSELGHVESHEACRRRQEKTPERDHMDNRRSGHHSLGDTTRDDIKGGGGALFGPGPTCTDADTDTSSFEFRGPKPWGLSWLLLLLQVEAIHLLSGVRESTCVSRVFFSPFDRGGICSSLSLFSVRTSIAICRFLLFLLLRA